MTALAAGVPTGLTPIVVPMWKPQLQLAVEAFVESTALADCTTVAGDDLSLDITPRWPVEGWSSGEKHLWAFLHLMTSGELAHHLAAVDDRNATAMRVLLMAVTG